MTAKLFASAVSSNTTSAYEWILEAVEDSAIAEMTSELEIAKAIQHLKAKEFLKVATRFKMMTVYSQCKTGHRDFEGIRKKGEQISKCSIYNSFFPIPIRWRYTAS